MNNSASDGLALSEDGRTLLFCSRRGGNSDIWSRDLTTGKEMSLVVSPAEEHVVAASADASTFVYYLAGSPTPVFLGTSSGAAPRKLCERCSHFALSRDGSKLLYVQEPEHYVYHLMDTASGESTPLLSHPTAGFAAAAFSSDGQSVVFRQKGQLIAAPVRSSLVDEKEWIRLTTREGTYSLLAFSPDGAYLYYLSNEDGHDCIYARPLGAALRPSGPAVAIAHLHEGNTLTFPRGMRVAADKIVLLLNQGTSNIWMMQLGLQSN
jgi:Tol biopolymer transport system component